VAIRAKYEGLCPICRRPIRKGYWIEKVGGEWVHADCAEKVRKQHGKYAEDVVAERAYWMIMEQRAQRKRRYGDIPSIDTITERTFMCER